VYHCSNLGWIQTHQVFEGLGAFIYGNFNLTGERSRSRASAGCQLLMGRLKAGVSIEQAQADISAGVALGPQTRNVMRLVIGQGMKLAFVVS
jgi:hypothetical protein